MNIQDQIDQLALAILRSTPSMDRCAQQTTFTRPFEKHQRMTTVETSANCRDGRQASASRAPRAAALAGATAPWPFCAREVWL